MEGTEQSKEENTMAKHRIELLEDLRKAGAEGDVDFLREGGQGAGGGGDGDGSEQEDRRRPVRAP